MSLVITVRRSQSPQLHEMHSLGEMIYLDFGDRIVKNDNAALLYIYPRRTEIQNTKILK